MGKIIEFIKKNKVAIGVTTLLAVGGGILIASENKKNKRLRSENNDLRKENEDLKSSKSELTKEKNISTVTSRFLKKDLDNIREEENSRRFTLVIRPTKENEQSKMWIGKPKQDYKFDGIPVSDKQIDKLSDCLTDILKESRPYLRNDVKVEI